jgi:hypothetical protein
VITLQPTHILYLKRVDPEIIEADQGDSVLDSKPEKKRLHELVPPLKCGPVWRLRTTAQLNGALLQVHSNLKR